MAWLAVAALSLLALALTWLTASLDPTLTESGWRTFIEPQSDSEYRPEPASLPTAGTLFLAWQSVDEAPFRIAWTGCVRADTPGPHRFLIRQTGTSRLVVDGRLLDATHDESLSGVVVSEISLEPGPHNLRLSFEPWQGAGQLEFWLQRPGGVPRRLEEEAAALAPRCLSREWWRWRPLTTRLPTASVAAWILVAFLLLGLGGVVLARRVVRDDAFWRNMWPWVAGTTVAGAWGIWWGLPELLYGWAADEIAPLTLLRALDHGFAPPWADKYPPLHYYTLSLAARLVGLAGAPVGISAYHPPGSTLLQVSMRLISVAMSTGTVIGVGALAHRSLGRPQGRLAMLALLASPTWLYYAKLANVDVPYLFWLAWALVAFVALIERPTQWAAAGLGLCAGCAVATKDQVVGFFLLMPVALLAADVDQRRRQGELAPVRRALTNPAWLVGLVVAAVTLAVVYQWPVNGYLWREHVELALLARYPPMAEATVAGYLSLSGLVARQAAFTMGWPLFVLAVLGTLWVAAERKPRPLTWLLVPVLSYFTFFVAVARYSYDRFLLGIVLILAVFAAHAAARLMSIEGRWRPVVRAGMTLALIYSVGYGLTTNQMMVRDARVAAETVLDGKVTPGETVGFVGWRQYLPRLGKFWLVDVKPSVESLTKHAPRWLVVNERFNRRLTRVPGAEAFFASLDRGELGCRRVFTGPSPLSWWAFAQYTEWLRQPGESGYIILDKVNPPVVVYSCASEAVTDR